MRRKEKGWVHFKIKSVLFYFIFKSHRENLSSNSSSYGTFHQDVVGDIYWTSWDPVRALRFTMLGGEGERRETALAGVGLVFICTVEGKENRWRTGLG